MLANVGHSQPPFPPHQSNTSIHTATLESESAKQFQFENLNSIAQFGLDMLREKCFKNIVSIEPMANSTNWHVAAGVRVTKGLDNSTSKEVTDHKFQLDTRISDCEYDTKWKDDNDNNTQRRDFSVDYLEKYYLQHWLTEKGIISAVDTIFPSNEYKVSIQPNYSGSDKEKVLTSVRLVFEDDSGDFNQLASQFSTQINRHVLEGTNFLEFNIQESQPGITIIANSPQQKLPAQLRNTQAQTPSSVSTTSTEESSAEERKEEWKKEFADVIAKFGDGECNLLELRHLKNLKKICKTLDDSGWADCYQFEQHEGDYDRDTKTGNNILAKIVIRIDMSKSKNLIRAEIDNIAAILVESWNNNSLVLRAGKTKDKNEARIVLDQMILGDGPSPATVTPTAPVTATTATTRTTAPPAC